MFFPKTYFPNLNAHRNSAAGAPRCSSFELGKNATENVGSFELTSLEKIPNYPTTQRNTTKLNITRTRAWEQCQHYAPKSKQSKLLNMLETENKFTYLPIYLMKEIDSYRNVLGAWLDRCSPCTHRWAQLVGTRVASAKIDSPLAKWYISTTVKLETSQDSS